MEKREEKGATEFVMDLHAFSVYLGSIQHVQNQELYFCCVYLHFILFYVCTVQAL